MFTVRYGSALPDSFVVVPCWRACRLSPELERVRDPRMAGLYLARAADRLRARAQHLVHFMPSANQRVVEYIKNRVNKDLGALERQIVEIEKLPSDQLLGRMGDLIKLYREHKARRRARHKKLSRKVPPAPPPRL